MNGTVTPQHDGDGRDGAVEEEHAARQKPRTNAVRSRIMIVPFCDRNEDLQSILGLALTLKVDSTPATAVTARLSQPHLVPTHENAAHH
jgi:hypothetical protein